MIKKQGEKKCNHLLPAQQHGGQVCLSWGMGTFAFNSFETGDRYCARNNLLTQLLFLQVNVWPRPKAKCVYSPNIISSHFFSPKVRKFTLGKRINVHRHTESLQVGGDPKLKIFETLCKHMHIPTWESEPVCTVKNLCPSSLV